ncbi:MAG: MoxR family ATPase [Magnetococcales bacterium]|nr:MoxR family ATPase [Magnetococcales bacterium]
MSVIKEIQQLFKQVSNQIIGQETLINRLLIALLANGHLLVEGAPGLAKTRAIKVLSSGVSGDFHRIQFTPDLLPSDLTGTDVFRPQDGTFHFQKGPLFHNLILADEINRAPAKVQSALLEAMGEGQITVGSTTYALPDLFLVMATQNPIEQEGTHPLPEAQLDRFLMLTRIDYPSYESERAILHLVQNEAKAGTNGLPVNSGPRLDKETLFSARQEILALHMAENLETYLLQLIMATRDPRCLGEEYANILQYGASPRATIALDRCARANAWLTGRDYVTPEDIQNLAYDVLRHRILLTFEAEADGLTPDGFISQLLARIPVP